MFGDSIKAGVKGNRQNGDVLVLAWEILLDLKPQDLLVGRPLFKEWCSILVSLLFLKAGLKIR